MDKNAIKKYAVWARTEMIARVAQKALSYGIAEGDILPATADSINGKLLTLSEMQQRQALIARIEAKGYEQVMEEVAYTWFNRFIALRFMEVNGYLPSMIRVFSNEENEFKPQILAEAINLELDSLDIIVQNPEDMRRLWDLLEETVPDIYVTSSVQQLIEISHRDAGKHSGLRFVTELLQLDPAQTAAFGDGDNDADLLAYAGCGIAMANASPSCLAAADHVTLDHREDGVAHGIYHILRV